MKHITLLILFFYSFTTAFTQVLKGGENMILFRGIILDAGTRMPLQNSQMFINSSFASVSDRDGKFSFYVNRTDTVVFRTLGYSEALMFVSDTLQGKEFIAGIFMSPDTISIPEVVILPRISTLKADLLRPPPAASKELENARYNLAVSAYQGRVNPGNLGDPSMNYEHIRQQQKMDAYTKGQIPPDKIAGISPLLLIPAVYLLMNGMPEKPAAVKPVVTDQETDLIIERYLEAVKLRQKTKETR